MTSSDRVVAFGTEMVRIHDWLRESMDRLRDAISDPANADPVEIGLTTRCLAFCAALTGHHQTEDAVAFPTLAEQVPELAPVLEELAFDHQQIATVVQRVVRLAEKAAGRQALTAPADRESPEEIHRPELLLGELDGLAAVLESHFRWEERRIVEALNSLRLPGRSAQQFLGVAIPTD